MSEEHELVATFEDVERAREAVLALEREGIEGSSVTLESAPEGRPPAETTDTREGDRQLGGDVGKRVAIGALVGTLAGAIVGLALGLSAFSGAGVWASAIGGAIAGGAVGGVIGGVSGIGTSGAWQRTYAQIREGPVVVAVRHADHGTVDVAERTLRDHRPQGLERHDAGGRTSS